MYNLLPNLIFSKMLSKSQTKAVLLGTLQLTNASFLKEKDDDCSNFNGNVGCTDGEQTRYPDDWAKRSFQTFLKDGPDAHMYKDEYEGLGRVMCFNQVVYAADKKSATITAKCRQHDSITELQYNWNGAGFVADETFEVDESVKEEVSLVVKAIDGDKKEFTITMEPTNLVW